MLLEDGTPSRPKTLYAVSKLATEVAGSGWGQLWDMDVRAVRLSSLYGRGSARRACATRCPPITR